MNPLDVALFEGPCPLVGVFGRSELEVAAAFIVLACQVDNCWRAVSPPEVGLALDNSVDAHRMWNNPFLRPDIGDLVAKGFAAWSGEALASPVQLTEAGLDRIRRSSHNRVRSDPAA